MHACLACAVLLFEDCMHMRIAGVLTATLFAATAFGQQIDRTFHFAHAGTVQEMQEITTMVRAIAEIKQMAPDTEQKLLSVRGSAGQIALTEWLMNELDQPMGAQHG